ncbi:MAG: hypothetical protein FWE37_02525 [Spirochaetaceae bacterium]|nr:hypothetical protein [Spirochaetaceae bacterium]
MEQKVKYYSASRLSRLLGGTPSPTSIIAMCDRGVIRATIMNDGNGLKLRRRYIISSVAIREVFPDFKD